MTVYVVTNDERENEIIGIFSSEFFLAQYFTKKEFKEITDDGWVIYDFTDKSSEEISEFLQVNNYPYTIQEIEVQW